MKNDEASVPLSPAQEKIMTAAPTVTRFEPCPNPDCDEGTCVIETGGPAGAVTMSCETCDGSGFVPLSPEPSALRVETVALSVETRTAIARNLAAGRHVSGEPGHSGEFEDCQHPSCVASLSPAPAPLKELENAMERVMLPANTEVCINGVSVNLIADTVVKVAYEQMSRLVGYHEGPFRDTGEPVSALSPQPPTSEVERLRSLCAELYQVAGVLNADARVLDNLSAAASGKPIPHASLLPYGSPHPRSEERWQPIETAPKDGTRILGLVPGGAMYVGWWLPASRMWSVFDTFSANGSAIFTHWMPLPSPPSEERK